MGSVPFEIFFADVRHKFYGSLFLREIGGHLNDTARDCGKLVSGCQVSRIAARFIEPMLLQRAEKLPEDGIWLYELKLDGFRAEAIKSGGRVRFTSRNDRDFNAKYPAIVHALHAMPDETVIDGEIVALD